MFMYIITLIFLKRLKFLFVQDDIEVKKDTERADEIRAMKKAWENAEPGRAAKVRHRSQHGYCKVLYFRGFQNWISSRGLKFAVRQFICTVR